ncbi:hypothetical protein E3N88_16149 [Mikania micrantha]|uniref:PGG domain-containing protein n=1 Tax=Mikania micrantha TaxID=192012 RepID=A0A5N6NXM9_9ASTR|nr:hypothetical protein E3N88_16149 [Mikania micrantha]
MNNNTGTASGPSISAIPLNRHQQQQNYTVVPIASMLAASPVPPPPPPPNLPRLDLLQAIVGLNWTIHETEALLTDREVTGPKPTKCVIGVKYLDVEVEVTLQFKRITRENYFKVGVPLYEAAVKGDWKAAKLILDKQRDLTRFAITENYEILLHVAASAESTKCVEEFVMNLVDMMDIKDLGLQNKQSHTALSLAAAAGNIKTARIMVKKNPTLIDIPVNNKMMPLYMAAYYAKSDMVRYLYDLSKKMRGDFWDHENRGWVLQRCVEADMFDVALKIVNDRPELLVKKKLLTDVLLALAQKRDAFKGNKPHIVFKIINSILHVKVMPDEKESEAMQLLKLIWEKVTTMPKSDIDNIIRGPVVEVKNENTIKKTYPSRVLFLAAKTGNTRFIVELIRFYPDLIWKKDDKGKTIFHLAAKCRQIEIYKLLYEIGAMKDLIIPVSDINDNNMLHMVAKSGKQKRYQDVPGVAFQLQQELLWFKEVKEMIPPRYRQRKNKEGKIPEDLFTSKHADLVTKGEVWMKDTASHCMVVATLIATIVFAAAFTLPGGYNQDTGIPFFRKEPSLIVFVISDAISLITSSTSVLIFLSILTSRYAEVDFLELLPKKLVNGLATLFVSIVTMMVAFSASFFVLYNKKLEWVPVSITSVAGIPVILYVILQYRLFRDVFKSAYSSRNLFKRNRRVLYY